MFIFATGVEPNKPPCHSRQVFKTTNFITFEMHEAVQLISLIGCSIAVPVVQNDGGGEDIVVQAKGRSDSIWICNDMPCVIIY